MISYCDAFLSFSCGCRFRSKSPVASRFGISALTLNTFPIWRAKYGPKNATGCKAPLGNRHPMSTAGGTSSFTDLDPPALPGHQLPLGP